VKPLDAELPEQERERVGELFVALLLRRAVAVTGVEVDAQKHGLSARRSRLQPRRHLRRLPRVDARIVDAGHDQHRRILRAVAMW
jgi:hypothetical protein